MKTIMTVSMGGDGGGVDDALSIRIRRICRVAVRALHESIHFAVDALELEENAMIRRKSLLRALLGARARLIRLIVLIRWTRTQYVSLWRAYTQHICPALVQLVPFKRWLQPLQHCSSWLHGRALFPVHDLHSSLHCVSLNTYALLPRCIYQPSIDVDLHTSIVPHRIDYHHRTSRYQRKQEEHHYECMVRNRLMALHSLRIMKEKCDRIGDSMIIVGYDDNGHTISLCMQRVLRVEMALRMYLERPSNDRLQWHIFTIVFLLRAYDYDSTRYHDDDDDRHVVVNEWQNAWILSRLRYHLLSSSPSSSIVDAFSRVKRFASLAILRVIECQAKNIDGIIATRIDDNDNELCIGYWNNCAQIVFTIIDNDVWIDHKSISSSSSSSIRLRVDPMAISLRRILNQAQNIRAHNRLESLKRQLDAFKAQFYSMHCIDNDPLFNAPSLYIYVLSPRLNNVDDDDDENDDALCRIVIDTTSGGMFMNMSNGGNINADDRDIHMLYDALCTQRARIISQRLFELLKIRGYDPFFIDCTSLSSSSVVSWFRVRSRHQINDTIDLRFHAQTMEYRRFRLRNDDHPTNNVKHRKRPSSAIQMIGMDDEDHQQIDEWIQLHGTQSTSQVDCAIRRLIHCEWNPKPILDTIAKMEMLQAIGNE